MTVATIRSLTVRDGDEIDVGSLSFGFMAVNAVRCKVLMIQVRDRVFFRFLNNGRLLGSARRQKSPEHKAPKHHFPLCKIFRHAALPFAECLGLARFYRLAKLSFDLDTDALQKGKRHDGPRKNKEKIVLQL